MKNKIFPLGDAALTIEFGNEISLELNNRVIRLARFFEANSFPGFIETIPAYASLTVFYNVSIVRKNFPEFPTAFDAVKTFAEHAWQNAVELTKAESPLVEIPICFDAEYALDLASVAAENNLTEQDVARIYLSKIYRVYMLGFLPGFAYMGKVDERVAAPRKSSPRLKVPRGSVGIAGRQTGIYSLESPGGWQIIGKTNIELFTPNAEQPTFLRAGDSVKFYAANF
jgi:inhibitor of KinA